MATRYRRSDRYVYRLTVGEHLLVSLHGNRRETLHALTPTGAVLWEGLADWMTLEDLAALLVRDFDVDRTSALSDTEEFLEQLRSIGALENED